MHDKFEGRGHNKKNIVRKITLKNNVLKKKILKILY